MSGPQSEPMSDPYTFSEPLTVEEFRFLWFAVNEAEIKGSFAEVVTALKAKFPKIPAG